MISGRRLAVCRVVLLLAAAVAAACGGASPTRPTTVTATPVSAVPSPPSGETSPTPPPPDAPAVKPLSATRFLAFGDSLTQGVSVVVSSRLTLGSVTAYPTFLQQLLGLRYTAQTVQVFNAGRSGEWAQDGQYRLPTELARYSPEALLLLEGVNDLSALGRAAIPGTTVAIESMVVEARRRNLTVFLATLPPQRPGAARATTIDLLPEYNDWIRRIARDRGAVLVDLHAAFGTQYDLLSEDGLHPSVEGYRFIGQAFADAIQRTLGLVPDERITLR